VNILFIASRPPWPPTDGGRVLMAYTVEGLLSRGHHVTVVAPTRVESAVTGQAAAPVSDRLRVFLVPDRRPSGFAAAVMSVVQGWPLSVVRQSSPPTRVEVARRLGAERFDVVHVQQLQALPKADAAFDRLVPVVMRAENVESDLWHALSATRPLLRPLASFEAHRLARYEARSLGRVAATAALTDSDARRLRRLAPDADIDVVPAPMPTELPAGRTVLDGDPPVVVVASRWLPNQEGVIWFAQKMWPSVLRALPQARLHLFGADRKAAGAGMVRHDELHESRDAYAPGATLVVPLRIASGVRVRILEAWARGVPVVATRAAVEGLDVADGHGVRLADTADAFVRVVRDLRDSPDTRERLVSAGRALLAERHDPDVCAARLEAIYRRVMLGVEASSPSSTRL
jgi:glycosyltransferase involved in cell wall biosynthesis